MDQLMNANHQPSIFRRLLSAVIPMLLVAISYIDPGKWAAAVEGGARFGSDILIPMLLLNFAAILCQYLSACIAVVTEKDLAQICSEEYDKVTCIFLGVQSELSMIVFDLTMILGAAHGLNLIFGADLLFCVFLTAIDASLYPVFSTFLEESKAKFLCIFMGGFILFTYVFAILISQSGMPLFMGGMLTKLSGESAPAMMSLLGASIMPHNFYLHSSVVKQQQEGTSISKETVCHDHLISILCIFSSIFVVNYVLVNSAANVFYSTGLLLTFQDALSLIDQVFRNLVLPYALIFVLIFSNHITALTWKLGRQTVLHNFFRVTFPGWLHHAIIRVIAIFPALYCVWNSGPEGIYQLLISSQILIALSLPSSVIPLFRVATSKSIMGAYKISQSVEFLVLVTFIGMLGLEIIFVIEMIFGDSDWVINLRWNMGSGMSVFYVVLLITACVSLLLMLWLAATPLRSASSRLDARTHNWNTQDSSPESSTETDPNNNFNFSRHNVDESNQKQEAVLAFVVNHLDMPTSTPALSMTLNSESRHQMKIAEDCSDTTYSSHSVCYPRESAITVDTVPGSSICTESSSVGESKDATTVGTEMMDLLEKTASVEKESLTKKSNSREVLECGESSAAERGSSPSVNSEGLGSYRSLSGKSDDVGSGAGSLSKLAGLGRAARRQLAVVLDEFWGQLFDFHGQATQEAKIRKLDMLLGVNSAVDPKNTFSSPKVEDSKNLLTENIPYLGVRVSSPLTDPSSYDSPRQHVGQRLQSFTASYGVQRGSSPLWSSNTQMLDTYMQSSINSAMDSGERRYSSLRFPPSPDVCNIQPATVHGYQMAYLSRITKERMSGALTGQMESLAPKSSSLVSSKYRESFALSSGQKSRNVPITKTPPGFPSLAVSRSSTLHTEKPFYGVSSIGPVDNVGGSVSVKKYHSLPDISGLSLPYRNSLLPEKDLPWDSPTIREQSIGHPNSLSKASFPLSNGGGPLVFDEFSSSKVCRDAFSLQLNSSSHTGSLWSRQPFEQFGVSEKACSNEGEEVGSMQGTMAQESAPAVDSETKLLLSFRICIQKILKLEGSDWLFRQNDGADEDLVDCVAAREKFLCEVENRISYMGESHWPVNKKLGFAQKYEEIVTSVPHCGEGCIWKVDLIISFGVWCIHRVLELSLMESRPELWGKYTYVLNRLQGITNPAFSKPRSPRTPCLCLEIPVAHQQQSSLPISNGNLPPHAKQARGKCTTAAMLLDMVMDVEIAISCRKGRTGTAAGDVAFPKGKENLASVLKRYKRRLTNKPVGPQDIGSVSHYVSL